jgi:hypothetical protein
LVSGLYPNMKSSSRTTKSGATAVWNKLSSKAGARSSISQWVTFEETMTNELQKPWHYVNHESYLEMVVFFFLGFERVEVSCSVEASRGVEHSRYNLKL